MPSRRIKVRIRQLCTQAAAAEDTSFAEIFSKLQSALHEHVEQTREMAVSSQRLRELVAKIETEKDWNEFSTLVEDLSRELEHNQFVNKPFINKAPPPAA